MKFNKLDMFVLGFLVGCVSATVLSFLLMFKVFEQSFQNRLDNAGIRLEHHYIEQDGVRTNWTDVVFLDDKGNKALTMHPFRYQATPIKEQGKR